MTKVIETHPELDELIKEYKTETVAEEALRILEPIPEEKWCTGSFLDDKGKRCAIGHYIHKKTGRVDNDGDLFGGHTKCAIRISSIEFLNEGQMSIADVNNGYFGTLHGYSQPTPKQRTIALLSDMIKAGY